MKRRFEVIQELASHSRARLLRVRDTQANEEVTLRRYTGTPEDIEALQALLVGVAELDHPNIEQFIELGDDDEGLFAIVDAPWGESLSEVLKNGPLTAAEFDQVARQLMEALTALHAAGYPHLALRPEVVRLKKEEDGTWAVRLTGFGEGFGRPLNAEQADISAYRCCAPEHWRGEPVGRRTDVYALGCILYEALANRHAFPGSNAQMLRHAHLEHDIVRLDQEAPQVPKWMAAWVMKLTEPDMAYRLKNAEQARDLYDMGEQSLPATISALSPSQDFPPPAQAAQDPAVWAVPVGEDDASAPYAIPRPPAHPATAMVPTQPGPYTTQMIPVQPPPRSPSGSVGPQRPTMPPAARPSSPVTLHSHPGGNGPRQTTGAAAPSPARSVEEKRVLFSIVAAVVCVVGILLFFILGRSGAPKGPPAPTTLTVTSGLLMHLDATAPGTLSLDPSTGRIRRWENVRGAPPHAVQMDGEAQPARSTQGPAGKLVVDFGAPNSNRWLVFGNNTGGVLRQDKIRTLFWVGRGAGYLLGDNTGTAFARGEPGWAPGSAIWAINAAAPEVKDGITRLNGQQVNGTNTKLAPNEFALVSVVATGDAAAAYLCRDRNTTGRTGGQQICEVLLYNRPLNEVEVKQVEAYLMHKWLGK